MPPRPKANGKQPTRSWRFIAKELAREIDPIKARALFEELSHAIRFVRYEDLVEDPAVPDYKRDAFMTLLVHVANTHRY